MGAKQSYRLLGWVQIRVVAVARTSPRQKRTACAQQWHLQMCLCAYRGRINPIPERTSVPPITSASRRQAEVSPPRIRVDCARACVPRRLRVSSSVRTCPATRFIPTPGRASSRDMSKGRTIAPSLTTAKFKVAACRDSSSIHRLL